MESPLVRQAVTPRASVYPSVSGRRQLPRGKPELGASLGMPTEPRCRVRSCELRCKPCRGAAGLRAPCGAPHRAALTHRPRAVVPDAVHQPQSLQLLLLEA